MGLLFHWLGRAHKLYCAWCNRAIKDCRTVEVKRPELTAMHWYVQYRQSIARCGDYWQSSVEINNL